MRLMLCFFLALLTLAGAPSDAVTRPAIRVGLFPFHSPQHLDAYAAELKMKFPVQPIPNDTRLYR